MWFEVRGLKPIKVGGGEPWRALDDVRKESGYYVGKSRVRLRRATIAPGLLARFCGASGDQRGAESRQ